MTGSRTCDYCTASILSGALRCPSCQGEFRFCGNAACRRLRGVKGWSFKGLLRGGLKRRCIFCTQPI